MVEHALRFEAQEKVWLAQVVRIAGGDNNDFKQFISAMERHTHDILEEEIIRPTALKNILDK